MQAACLCVLCCTLAGGEIKEEDKPHVSAASATTGKAEKWVIYMPTKSSGSNLHASCSAFQPRQQIKRRKEEGKALGGGKRGERERILGEIKIIDD